MITTTTTTSTATATITSITQLQQPKHIMSNVKDSKEHLDLCVTTFNRTISALTRATKGRNTRSLRQKIDAVESSLSDLNAAHTSWVSKAEFDEQQLDAEPLNKKWLASRWEEADVLMEEANEIIHEVETESQPKPLKADQQLLVLAEKMKSMQLGIENKINTLMKHTAVTEITPTSHTLYIEMSSDVQKLLETSFKELSNKIVDLGGNDLATTISTH